MKGALSASSGEDSVEHRPFTHLFSCSMFSQGLPRRRAWRREGSAAQVEERAFSPDSLPARGLAYTNMVLSRRPKQAPSGRAWIC